MLVIGIDPGLAGALASIALPESQVIRIDRTPVIGTKRKDYNQRAMFELIRDLGANYGGIRHAWIEESRAMPMDRTKGKHKCPACGMGKPATGSLHKMGFGYGIWQAMLTANDVSFTIVPPRAWQREQLAGLPVRDKQSSILAACRLCPTSQGLLKGPRGGFLHGHCDALLIAMYGANRAGRA